MEVGVLLTNPVSVPLRSLFNANPLSQTSTSTSKNLANNIVIPPFSRITDIRLNNTVAYSNTTYVEIGTNVAQAAGATLNSFDQDYFAGDTANDTATVGNWHIPAYFDQTQAQATNCLNVSDDDASGYEIDKAVAITVNTDDALSAGQGYLYIEWLQKVNGTN